MSAEKGEAFRALHAGPPFLIPNPWDAGSARVLESLGFRALATTSSGFAFTLGRRDGGATLDELCAHVALLDAVCALPVSADMENGYGAAPEDAARAVAAIAEAGAAGGSIEDFDRDGGGIYAFGDAVARVEAAVDAARAAPHPFTLTARSENQLHGDRDLSQTIARLQAFEAAGADVLFAPGLRTMDEVRAVCSSVSKPVNVLGRPGMTVRELFGAGAQRVSVGGALTWVAARALREAAEGLLAGDLSALEGASAPLS